MIVPRSLLELEEPLRRLVLCHEREHCAAHDPWFLVSGALAVACFPWNVPLWFIVRRLHLALELDCDARVLAAGADPRRYGQLLLWVAQRGKTLDLAPMLAPQPSHLERRIIAMRTRLVRPPLLHLVAAGLLLVVAVVGACTEGAPNAPGTISIVSADERGAAQATISETPYFEFQVEHTVRQLPGTGNLRYPTGMRLANREGEVLAQFVVDARGIVDVRSFKALKSSDKAFTDAVVTALPAMRFTPALIGGRAVAQVVRQPFTFALQSN